MQSSIKDGHAKAEVSLACPAYLRTHRCGSQLTVVTVEEEGPCSTMLVKSIDNLALVVVRSAVVSKHEGQRQSAISGNGLTWIFD